MYVDDMSDYQYERLAVRAVKSRDTNPGWWLCFLTPDLIDETESVVRKVSAEVQEWIDANPERGRKSLFFLNKLEGALEEIALERIAQEMA